MPKVKETQETMRGMLLAEVGRIRDLVAHEAAYYVPFLESNAKRDTAHTPIMISHQPRYLDVRITTRLNQIAPYRCCKF